MSSPATRPTWDEVRLHIARKLSERSLCVRDHVGCVIVDKHQKIIAEGYNNPPRGFIHHRTPCIEWCGRAQNLGHIDDRNYANCPSLHAEANALLMVDRTLCAGGTLYVTSDVCFGCAKLIANSGLRRVVVEYDDKHSYRHDPAVYLFLTNTTYEIEVVRRRRGES